MLVRVLGGCPHACRHSSSVNCIPIFNMGHALCFVGLAYLVGLNANRLLRCRYVRNLMHDAGLTVRWGGLCPQQPAVVCVAGKPNHLSPTPVTSAAQHTTLWDSLR